LKLRIWDDKVEPMTEAEWLKCSDPTAMLAQLRDKASERKLRLYTCAHCRLVWHWLIEERSRSAVEVAEHYADGLITEEDREVAFREACTASIAVRRCPEKSDTILRLRQPRDPDRLYRAAFFAAFAAGSGVGNITAQIRGDNAHLVGKVTRSRLLHCIFGNPFRPASIKPPWLTTNIILQAQSIYDGRSFNCLPSLANSLDENGCDNKDMLSHCRSLEPHVRGCWVVDLALGKN
jgi:hypothetical protein